MGSVYETSEFRNGLKIEVDGIPYTVVYFQFVKPGKGTAFTRTKLKSLLNGNVIERTYRTGEVVDAADIEEHSMAFLYRIQDTLTFMNNESYEQVEIPAESMGDDAAFLMENLEVSILFWRGKPVNVRLQEYATTAFAVVLLTFMAYVSFNDVWKRSGLFKSMFQQDSQVESAPAPVK